MHVSVVRNGQAVHAELLDVRDEFRDLIGPVEQRVFAVGMEMDEGHYGYGLLAMRYGLPRLPTQPAAHDP
jgi:hypothetical protein